MLKSILSPLIKGSLGNYNFQMQRIKRIGLFYLSLDQVELRAQTLYLKNRLSRFPLQQSNVANIAFALVTEATTRILNIRHYDVQIIGGFVLNDGKIAEMKTGEGKTIVALLPIFFNALYENGTQVITVNDYLAKRDAYSVGRIHCLLGLTVGLVQETMSFKERKSNYNSDIIYITNNELGFDYLRDNMTFTLREIVQRTFFFAVIDEIDSVLIDESKTPLIISGSNYRPSYKYIQAAKLASVLKKRLHYVVDEKRQSVVLIEEGIIFCEKALNSSNLYSSENPWISYVLNSLKSKELFKLNTHYIINDKKEIVIVDEFTGRTMPGRRWGNGLHQAIEAKEHVKIQNESETLASITYQNLFLLYRKMCGMTGTCKTEELELEQIYNLKVDQIPPFRSIKRKDFPDLVYKNDYRKWQAIIIECVNMYQMGRPVLVGTTTIERSELLALLLSENNIPYQLLNARPENNERESDIIALAGRKQAVTISTNMAGRGTDIILGGNKKIFTLRSLQTIFKNIKTVINRRTFCYLYKYLRLYKEKYGYVEIVFQATKEKLPVTFSKGSFLVYYFKLIKSLTKNQTFEKSTNNLLLTSFFSVLKQHNQRIKLDKLYIKKVGGLHVIGTERHDSRRIDNQLRGRSGRQGDPGSSRFFLSFEDKLLRLFGGNSISRMVQDFGIQSTIPVKSSFLNQSLEVAQSKVEAYYFDTRKELFEYSQVLTLQRNNIYKERCNILQNDSIQLWLTTYVKRSFNDLATYASNNKQNEKNKALAILKVEKLLVLPINISINLLLFKLGKKLYFLSIQFKIIYYLKKRELKCIEENILRGLERTLLLQQIDMSWKDHLQKDSLVKDSIKWRAYGQKNPLIEYKKESLKLFIMLLARIRHELISFILSFRILL